MIMLDYVKKKVIWETGSWSVQPTAHGLHAAQDGYECGLTQNCKYT